LPQWLREAVTRPGDDFTMTTQLRQGNKPGQSRVWPGDIVSMTCKQVCAKCNNGWMHDLEQAGRPWLVPMIRGAQVAITAEAQETIAKWAVKTAVMVHYLHSSPRPVAPGPLRWLLEERGSPSDVWVCLAAHSGTRWGVWCREECLSWGGPDPVSENAAGELFTLKVGYLVLQALIWPRGRHTVVHFTEDALPFIIQIWPRSDLARVWPPDASLDDEGLFALSEDFV
jgi:hypothetical protein